jgi:plasmid stabilization system protein ParE
MNLRIITTPRAEETYILLSDQLRQRWGDGFVVKFEIKIEKYLKVILTSPYIYPIVEENMELRRCILHKNCSMLYRIDNDVILIVCFWDNRQDPIIIS